MAKGKAMAWLRPTARAEKSVRAAYSFASREGEGLAQSQHLLLALVQEPQSFSTLLLAHLGVSPQDLSAELERLKAMPGNDQPGTEKEPTEQAWAQNRADLLDPARHAAQRLGDTHVGTEHLLLGLLREQDAKEREDDRETGIAGHALRNLGVTWDRASDALPALHRSGPS